MNEMSQISPRAWSFRSCPRQCHVRISRVPSVLAASSLLLGLVAVPSQAEQVATRPLAPAVVQGTPAQLLQEIPVTEPLTVGYRAGLFLSPAELKKKDKRGCTYRNQMLIKLATKKPRVGAGCKLSGGEWLIDFGLKKVKSASQVKLGKLFPDKFVYAQGAYGWTSEQRRAYATSASTVAKTTRSVSRGLLNENNIQLLSPSGLRALTSLNNVIQPGERTDNQVAAELDQIKKAFPGIYESWTVATLLNAKAWGISFTTPVKTQSYITIEQCSSASTLRYGNEKIEMRSPDLLKPISDASSILNLCKNTYVVINQATRYDIKPVPEFASAVPSTNDTVLNSYGTPQGAPIDRHLFGIHAPADWVSDVDTGFNGPIKEATIPNVPVGYLRLWDTETTWADLEPSNGTYVWRKLDKQIEMAQILDADVMMVLGGTPAWAGDGSPQSNPKSLDDWREYVFNVCKRYGAGIRSFEVWNEANLQTFWKGTAVEMADLTKAAFEEIRRCGSGALVVAANTTSRATGSFGTFYPAYLEALKERNWPVDAYSVHSYPTASGGADDRIKGIGQFRTMLALAGAPQTTVFDTEINYGLAGLGEGKVDLSGDNAMTLMARTYIDSVRYGFGSTFWFVWTANPDSKFGIQFTRQASAERQAWNTTYDWLVGAQYQRCFETREAVVVCQFNKGPQNFSIVWRGDVGAPTTATTAGYFTGLGSRACDLRGNCVALDKGIQVPIGPMPTRIDGAPIDGGPSSGSSSSDTSATPEVSILTKLLPPTIIDVDVAYGVQNRVTATATWAPPSNAAQWKLENYTYEWQFCDAKCVTVAKGSAASSASLAKASLTEGPGKYRFILKANATGYVNATLGDSALVSVVNRSATSSDTEDFTVASTRALPPSGVTLGVIRDQGAITWTPPGTKADLIKGYDVEIRNVSANGPWKVVSTANTTSTSFTASDVGVGLGQTMIARVRTVLKSGQKSPYAVSFEQELRQQANPPLVAFQAKGATVVIIATLPIPLSSYQGQDGATCVFPTNAIQVRYSEDGTNWAFALYKPEQLAKVATDLSLQLPAAAGELSAPACNVTGFVPPPGVTWTTSTKFQVRYIPASGLLPSEWKDF